jgi:hypothetical protein
MAIRMEDVAGLDFSEVAGIERIGPVTPGEVLREEFMLPLGLSGRHWRANLVCPRTGSRKLWLVGAPSPPRLRSCSASGSGHWPSSG